ncbi:helix-turn-helix domain-containing protein [Dickeya undicola]|uniref:XRE family transcriptional regulator n=1 Tax=Dickeya undicola TaxID=1577887 RepID=A0A3N0G033_9GAMM|nr:helix-turn-helix transcriptional regulator [Dickeya undicola]RNM05825.1 XRE family transcriptional regulator [Dickeya undicola]RNM25559.1 XRE family transcriptional regulator [Dickeya undicola]
MTMVKPSLPNALRLIRQARGLSQEAFSDVSSRTYLSSLERGLKSPTLKKLEELCSVLDVHPLTLLLISYAGKDLEKSEKIISDIYKETIRLNKLMNQ